MYSGSEFQMEKQQDTEQVDGVQRRIVRRIFSV